MTRFRERVACVVGAAGGMGYACATRLAAEGARVAICDRDGERLVAAAAKIEGSGAFELDVRDEVAVAKTIERIESSMGPLDHLVVSSGVFRAEPFFDTPPEIWGELFAVNLFGALSVLRAVGGRMKVRKRGSIVVVASQSAKVVRVRQAAYGASKAALTYATKAIGLELAPLGVRVNVVQPGTTDTPLARNLWDQGKGSADVHIRGALESFRAPIPLGKVGTADDVAGAVVFLLSDDAGHITMSEIVVDGGSSYIA
ncbi:MAG TPA: SDR family oxidoreductase [Polyangiaceae bacterium]